MTDATDARNLLQDKRTLIALVTTQRLRAETAEADAAHLQDVVDRENARALTAEAEAQNYSADYDRRGERLWRLAVLAGYVPTESDNDATAEQAIADVLAEVEQLRAKVARVEALVRAAWLAGQATADASQEVGEQNWRAMAVAYGEHFDRIRAALEGGE
jgi:hypothetical protein